MLPICTIFVLIGIKIFQDEVRDMEHFKEQIEKRLADFWDERAIAMAGEPQNISELGAPMDSLASMEALIEIDQLVGQEIPVDKVIKMGGYHTREEFVEHVTSNVLKFLAENPHV
jgi:hypothetical protein